MRGAPIASYGSVTLLVRDAEGGPLRAMEADETLYLDPSRSATPSRSLVVGENDLPDVVLEVDHTTDVRPGKLLLYEAWGFPELWVIVPPEGASPAAPGGRDDSPLAGRSVPVDAGERRVSGLDGVRDLRRDDGADALGPRPAGSSSAWGGPSARGRARDPRTIPLSRVLLAEGRSEGRAQELAAVVRSLLQVRGLAISPGFAAAAATLADVSRDTVTAAAYACADETDFWRRLGLPPR